MSQLALDDSKTQFAMPRRHMFSSFIVNFFLSFSNFFVTHTDRTSGPILTMCSLYNAFPCKNCTVWLCWYRSNL